MVKIEFEIPDWAIGRHIYLFAGTELLGVMEVKVFHEDGKHKTKYLPLKIKPSDGRCTSCGSCCSAGGMPIKLITEIYEKLKNFDERSGRCPLLGDNGCIMKAWTPFSCLKSPCSQYPGCTEKLVEVTESGN